MNFIELLPWICSGFSAIGSIFNIFKKKICFIIWTIGNIGFLFLNIKFEMYGQLPVWIVFIACNIYGYWKWSKEK
jgi:nicotinamide riboside transporter PnuC